MASEAKPCATVRVSGRLLNPSHFINEIDVYYDPLPTPPDINWLRVARSVSFSEDVVRMRPRALPGTVYRDGTRGDFDWDHKGQFHASIKLFHNEPGIYTIVCIVRRVATGKGFACAQVCILSK